MGRGRILKPRKQKRDKAVMTAGGNIVVVSRLPKHLRKGGRRVPRHHTPPKVRAPGDELMRELVGRRSYASLARATGRAPIAVSMFCRGLEANPGLRTLERFARALSVDESRVVEALRALWRGKAGPENALTANKTRARAGKAGGEVAAGLRATAPRDLAAELERALAEPSKPRPKLRPGLERLIRPPAPFYRQTEVEVRAIGIAPRGSDLDDDGDGFFWPDD